MKLYLARHACTTWNEENRIQGNHNPGLSAIGVKQAKRLAHRLKKEGEISFIYASDLLRAAKTARIIQKALCVPLCYERDLREIHLGSWEGKTPEEVDRLYRKAYRKWQQGPSRVRIPGGEPVPSFRRRVLGAFKRLLSNAPGGNMLVVAHGGVISIFLANLLKGSEDDFLLRLRLDNAGLSLVETTDRRRWVVCGINDTSHLSGVATFKGARVREKLWK